MNPIVRLLASVATALLVAPATAAEDRRMECSSAGGQYGDKTTTGRFVKMVDRDDWREKFPGDWYGFTKQGENSIVCVNVPDDKPKRQKLVNQAFLLGIPATITLKGYYEMTAIAF